MLMTRIVGMITLIVFSFMVFGCYSTPEANEVSEAKVKRFRYDDSERRYDIVLDRGDLDDPLKIKNAINSFVKDMGGTSYDYLKHGENDYYVTIPGKTPVDNGYYVVVDFAVKDDPVKVKYALNEFVKDKRGTSYDAVKQGENDYYVTIPGKTPVENLREVKQLNVGKTVTAIAVPTGIVIVLSVIIGAARAMNNPK